MRDYKGYTIKVLNKRQTSIFLNGNYINTVDSLSSALYVIDNDLI